MRRALCSALLIFAAAAIANGQDRPDFSGTWILINSKDTPSSAPQMLVVEASFRRRSPRGTPINPPLVTLTVNPRFGSAIRSGIYDVGMGGGVVGGLPNKGPQTESRHSTRWDGDKLVVDVAHYADRKLTSEHGEVWSLDAQGALSITVTDQVAGEPATTATLVYRREP